MTGLDTQVAVVGSGPAGWAAAAALAAVGIETVLVAPASDAAWPATYSCWVDELDADDRAAVVGPWWPTVRVVGHHEHDVLRAYALLDNGALSRRLAARFAEGGGRTVADAAVGARHFTWGSRLLLAGSRSLDVGLIVDATGRPGGTLLRRAGPARAHQTAYGLVARFTDPPIPARSCTLMDWTPPGLERRSGDDRPTFLYAMDLGDGSVLVEETALAAAPPMGEDELRARLATRLERLGATPVRVVRDEHVRIPMGGPVPRPQAVAAIGAAAGLVHPATGYSVAASLRAAPRLAVAVRRAVDAREAPDGVAEAAWSAVWPPRRRRARRLEDVGLSRLLAMDGDQVRSFFDAFFALPVDRWAPYLSGDAPVSAVARTMAAVFRSSPAGVRRRLARG